MPSPEHVPNFERFLQPDGDTTRQDLDAPPAGRPRIPRRAVLGIRHYWVPENQKSREHDIPARCAAGFETYGWPTRRHDLRSFGPRAFAAKGPRFLPSTTAMNGWSPISTNSCSIANRQRV
jgi:hypothetical protein